LFSALYNCNISITNGSYTAIEPLVFCKLLYWSQSVQSTELEMNRMNLCSVLYKGLKGPWPQSLTRAISVDLN